MSWHVEPTTLQAYAAGDLAGSALASVEAHLLACDRCRADLAALADPRELAASWESIRRAITTPAAAPAPAAVAAAPWGSGRPRMAVGLLATALLAAGLVRVAGAGPADHAPPSVAAPAPTTSPSDEPDVIVEPLDVPTYPAAPTPSPSDPPAPPPARPASEVRAAAAALVPFDACGSLLDHLREEGGQRVTAWGLPGSWSEPVAVPEAGGDGAPQPTSPAGGSQEASQTNVQEEGVDEPDRVETDGRHAYIARGDHVLVLDVSTGTPRQVARLDLSGSTDVQLLLDGDRLLALSRGWTQPRDPASGDTAASSPGTGPGPGQATQLALVDVGDPTAPRIVHRATVDGGLVDARRIGGVARVAIHSTPDELPFVYPNQDGRTEDEALAHNRQVVAESTLEQWVPEVAVQHGGDGATSRQLTACEVTHRPPTFSGFGSLSLLTFDVHGDLDDLHSTSVLSDGRTVYASKGSLYVATQRWYDPATQERVEGYETQLHAFDITDAAAARYLASGVVSGHLLNQFSMSEHGGFLRVATTEGAPWEPASVSSVRVLERRGDLLLPVGEITGLGQGERIYAVRFMGDVGYVVTFRQVDPLYTLDLADPAAPRVLGELKITGYSAYLHPTSPGRLLGLGREADEEGRATGMQLSLFDVSDLSAPRRLSQAMVADASSGAEYDHHAFLHWPATGLVVVPATTWGTDDQGRSTHWSGAVGVRLNGDTLDEVARIEHPGGDQESGHGPPPIERSFVVGPHLFTVSYAGILASDLHTLEDRGWLGFG